MSLLQLDPVKIGEQFRAIGSQFVKFARPTPKTQYALSGQLHYSDDRGYMLLAVPNSLVRGAFEALDESGAELPVDDGERLNAHISVMRPDEIAKAGGPNKITERGKFFSYTLGAVKTITPRNWAGVNRVWYIKVNSPELRAFRRSYGLPSQPNGDWDFHITIAVRKKGVLNENKISKVSYILRDYEPIKIAGDGVAVQLERAAKATDQNPTEAQQEAGNYKKGKFRLHGLLISIENPKGSTRSGTAKDGKKWSIVMKHLYGYINRTEGADGDHVDCFVGPDLESEDVFVINQVDPKSGKFDEHKACLAFRDEAAARKGYLANYEKGWKGLGSIKHMSIDKFKEWLDGDTTKRAARHDRDAGIQNLASNEDPLLLSLGYKLSAVRSQGYSSLQKVAGIFPGIFRGHGIKTAWAYIGSNQNNGKLHTEELSLGDKSGAGDQQEDDAFSKVSWKKGSGDRSCRTSRDQAGHVADEDRQLQVVGGGSVGDANQRTKTGGTLVNIPGQDTVTAAMGRGDGPVRTPAEPEVEQGLDARTGTNAPSAALKQLRRAKALSDDKRYNEKYHILQQMMIDSPESFVVDSTDGKHHGITHVPTGFRLHLPAEQIPSAIKQSAGRCPGCKRQFQKDEPYPDVDMCEVCERYGPPKQADATTAYPNLVEAAYAHPNKNGDRKICGNCTMWSRDNRCSIFAKDHEITKMMMCSYHVPGPPSDTRSDHPGLEPLDAKLGGLVMTTEGSACDNCTAYTAGDEEGMGKCRLVHENGEPADVEARGCCIRWDPISKKEAQPSLLQRSFQAQLYKPTWMKGQGLIPNLFTNLHQVRQRGQRMLAEEESLVRMRSALEPGFATRRLSNILSGQKPPYGSFLPNKWDRLILQGRL